MWKMCTMTWMKNWKVIFILQTVINVQFSVCVFTDVIEMTQYKPVPKGVKYILLWDGKAVYKNLFHVGDLLLHYDCPVDNCYVSSERHKFGRDLKKFDAILFSGWDQSWLQRKNLPWKRYYHQKYVFVQKQSAAESYICHDQFDSFFNWTMTYKLDSDIVLPHIHIRDINMEVIGPRRDMHWVTDMLEIDETLATDLETKTKAVAWFDSVCDPASNNSKYVDHLKNALHVRGLLIDVYGKCNYSLHCPKHECDSMLDEDYYFYLALEDSFAEDYVSESILRALRKNVVPIVYGGTKYDRFLPPQSYLDGTSQTPEALAASISSVIKNQTLYQQFFRWKSHYSFCAGQGSPNFMSHGRRYCTQTICDLCEALHESSLFNVSSVYEDFRRWWYPDYEHKCSQQRPENATKKLPDNKKNQLKELIAVWLGKKSETKRKVNKSTPKLKNVRKAVNSTGKMGVIKEAKNITGIMRNIKEPGKVTEKTGDTTKAMNLKEKLGNTKKAMDKTKNIVNTRKSLNLIEKKENTRKFLNLTEKYSRYPHASGRREYDYTPGVFGADIHTAALATRVADRVTDWVLGMFGWEVPAQGGGGGGGALVRTVGDWAIEVSRMRLSVVSNNFEID